MDLLYFGVARLRSRRRMTYGVTAFEFGVSGLVCRYRERVRTCLPMGILLCTHNIGTVIT